MSAKEPAGSKTELADMIDIIQANPYRILGIYSNSPTKERVANLGRIKAFLKVGKAVSFPLDLPTILPTVNRTTESVDQAKNNLTLPNDQFKYAQFWFVKATPIDDIAMNNLIAGNMEKAISIWEKKEDVTSLQNRIVCALINDDYKSTILYAEKLYPHYSDIFAKIVLGEAHPVVTDKLEYDFLDELCSALGEQKVLPYISNSDWKQYVGNKAVKPLIDSLQSAVDTAKTSRGKGSNARLVAGTKLMNDTKRMLKQLQTLIPITNLQYEMIADKVGIEILQCGIDYFNDTNDSDAPHEAMKLQSYALSVVVGKIAKDRCQENVNILKKIIANLPPSEVIQESNAIIEELRKFSKLPSKICYAVTLLNNTRPHLQSMRRKLGVNNSYYLKLSTQVVGNALHNTIEEVNAAMNSNGMPISPNDFINFNKKLKEAWKATEIMDRFDMESDFKLNHYNKNRATLKNICEQLGVFDTNVGQPVTKDDSNNSSVVAGLIGAVIGAVIGWLILSGSGLVIGAIIGFIIGLVKSK
ncbi:MAG: hypothetical protein LUC91_10445 [Prevotella sp.]|nr:hypothetical protein [Prevotella sp.]